eukprot:scaffold1255_cov76-Alexandrium_tamarense.AAC.1
MRATIAAKAIGSFCEGGGDGATPRSFRGGGGDGAMPKDIWDAGMAGLIYSGKGGLHPPAPRGALAPSNYIL